MEMALSTEPGAATELTYSRFLTWSLTAGTEMGDRGQNAAEV